MEKGEVHSVVAVGSGKGGVGKSSLTGLIGCEMARRGLKVGILDADITGPSIPKMLGQKGPLMDQGEGIEPATSEAGVVTVSSQFLLEEGQTPVVWRGPLVTRLIMQFFSGVHWGPLDYLLIDMPPGTSDVPLTVFQTIPIDGMVFATTPQEVSAIIVRKAMNMARELHVPLLGLVENMKHVHCDKCGNTIELYGPPRGEALAQEYDIPFLGGLPVDPKISQVADAGRLQDYKATDVSNIVDALLKSLEEARGRTLTTL